MSKYLHLDHLLVKEDGTGFTQEEADQFLDEFIGMIEARNWFTGGGMRLVDEEALDTPELDAAAQEHQRVVGLLDSWLSEKHPADECDGECVTTRRTLVEQVKELLQRELPAYESDSYRRQLEAQAEIPASPATSHGDGSGG